MAGPSPEWVGASSKEGETLLHSRGGSGEEWKNARETAETAAVGSWARECGELPKSYIAHVQLPMQYQVLHAITPLTCSGFVGGNSSYWSRAHSVEAPAHGRARSKSITTSSFRVISHGAFQNCPGLTCTSLQIRFRSGSWTVHVGSSLFRTCLCFKHL